jgi:SAM-dependent methyltransferase
VWRSRTDAEVSWYQPHASRSIALILDSVSPPDDAIIDVGAGTSPLACELAARGFRDLTLLDISPAALDRALSRLGPAADVVAFLAEDVTGFVPVRRYRLWHDRAVFHFLTDEADRARYAAIAASAVDPGGWLIVAGFAPDGPDSCSGLPVHRHSEASLTAVFAPAFTPVDFTREDHTTPAGALQHFLYGRFRRSAAPSTS